MSVSEREHEQARYLWMLMRDDLGPRPPHATSLPACRLRPFIMGAFELPSPVVLTLLLSNGKHNFCIGTNLEP